MSDVLLIGMDVVGSHLVALGVGLLVRNLTRMETQRCILLSVLLVLPSVLMLSGHATRQGFVPLAISVGLASILALLSMLYLAVDRIWHYLRK